MCLREILSQKAFFPIIDKIILHSFSKLPRLFFRFLLTQIVFPDFSRFPRFWETMMLLSCQKEQLLLTINVSSGSNYDTEDFHAYNEKNNPRVIPTTKTIARNMSTLINLSKQPKFQKPFQRKAQITTF